MPKLSCRVSLLAAAFLVSTPANAQIISGVSQPPSLSHELMLIVIGAVLGGFLGPLLMIIDSRLGISPGTKQQRENYRVQREIAASLRTLISMAERQNSGKSESKP
jgi:hypothetical protein